MKIQIENQTFSIRLGDLATQIYDAAAWLQTTWNTEEAFMKETGTEALDCRIRAFNGDWSFMTGDSQYDTDHRGYWAYGQIPYDCTKNRALELARELINELG